MASVKAFADAGNVVITEQEPQLRSDDDYEPPLPDTPAGATLQIMKDAPSPYENLDSLSDGANGPTDESPPLQQIKYDEDGKPIKPWEKKK